jgi:hypothetical protein
VFRDFHGVRSLNVSDSLRNEAVSQAKHLAALQKEQKEKTRLPEDPSDMEDEAIACALVSLDIVFDEPDAAAVPSYVTESPTVADHPSDVGLNDDFMPPTEAPALNTDLGELLGILLGDTTIKMWRRKMTHSDDELKEALRCFSQDERYAEHFSNAASALQTGNESCALIVGSLAKLFTNAFALPYFEQVKHDNLTHPEARCSLSAVSRNQQQPTASSQQ